MNAARSAVPCLQPPRPLHARAPPLCSPGPVGMGTTAQWASNGRRVSRKMWLLLQTRRACVEGRVGQCVCGHWPPGLCDSAAQPPISATRLCIGQTGGRLALGGQVGQRSLSTLHAPVCAERCWVRWPWRMPSFAREKKSYPWNSRSFPTTGEATIRWVSICLGGLPTLQLAHASTSPADFTHLRRRGRRR